MGQMLLAGIREGGAIGLGAFAQNEYNKVIDYALRIDNQLPIGNNNIEFGLLFNSVNTDYEANVNDSISIVNMSSSSNINALYIQNNLKMTDKLNFTIGLRSTYFSPTNDLLNAPRISFGWNLSHNFTLRGKMGSLLSIY